MANEFLEFCSTDTGTNLVDQSDYEVDADRVSGNKPGIARSALNNKALRQANFVASQLAQAVSDFTATDALDDANTSKFLSQLKAAIQFLPPVITAHLLSSGTHNVTYFFYVATASATASATYTNNSITFTVTTTIASGKLLQVTGPGAPTASGTLTKTSGTGNSTITFYAVRAPIALQVEMVGGGSGGDGTAGGSGGGTGGNTTFGTTLLVANGGSRITGGSVSLGSGPLGIGVAGGCGADVGTSTSGGCPGAAGPWGGQGNGGSAGAVGGNAAASSGAGGGAAGSGGGTGPGRSGCAGGYIKATILTPLSTYAWAVGAAGTAGSAGGGGQAGGVGGSGQIVVTEIFQ